MQSIIDLLNNLGAIATAITLIAALITAYLVFTGIAPVLYRLGVGLSTKKIAVFAESEFDSLKSMLVDSKIFKASNIIKIDKGAIKKAAEMKLLLVHWKSFESNIDEILNIKKDSAALIIYAPQSEGFIDQAILERINRERNSIIVNFRGRLLNDILTCMMTTGFEK